MSQSVKLPDPVYKCAKKEAERTDKSIGSVIDSWRFKAWIQDKEHGHEKTELTDEELDMSVNEFKEKYA